MSNMKLTEIYRTIKESKIILGEALDLATARKYTSIKRNPEIQKRIDSIFNKLSNLKNSKSSKRGDRIYIPMKRGQVDFEELGNSNFYRRVQGEISQGGFTLKSPEDLLNNIAYDKYGRQTKVTKALASLGNNVALSAYNTMRSKLGSQISDAYLVFSKHPYDIAGMSTDRGWNSCMNVYDGSNATYVQKDIEEGTIICYMISSNDLNITKPIARILIKPFVHIGDGSVLYVPEKVYGSPPKSFKEQVTKIFQTLQGERLGTFELADSLYCDLNPRITIYDPTFTEFLKNEKVASTVDEIKIVCAHLRIFDYRINQDMSIDVDGYIFIPDAIKMKKLPVKFNKVNGNFYCNNNELTTLKGAPIKVGGYFDCRGNDLRSLEGAPKEVRGDFHCTGNNLKSLKGAPKEVGGGFYCSENDLRSLEGAPQLVTDFNCSYNKLPSLKGAPKEVGGGFYCSYNKLPSLKGAPKGVVRFFNCHNNNLTSLEGAPIKVVRHFNCHNNNLKSLEGAPKEVRGDFNCEYNDVQFTEEQVRAVSNVRGDIRV